MTAFVQVAAAVWVRRDDVVGVTLAPGQLTLRLRNGVEQLIVDNEPSAPYYNADLAGLLRALTS